jgi:hypothetical protein
MTDFATLLDHLVEDREAVNKRARGQAQRRRALRRARDMRTAVAALDHTEPDDRPDTAEKAALLPAITDYLDSSNL